MWQMGLVSCPVSVGHQMVSDWSISCKWEQSLMVTHFGTQFFHNRVFCWSKKLFSVLQTFQNESHCWMLAFELCQFCWSDDCCDNKDQQHVKTSAVIECQETNDEGHRRRFARHRRRCRWQASIKLQATGLSVGHQQGKFTEPCKSGASVEESQEASNQSILGCNLTSARHNQPLEEDDWWAQEDFWKSSATINTVDQHTWTVQRHKHKTASTQKTVGTAGQHDWMCTCQSVHSNWRSVQV